MSLVAEKIYIGNVGTIIDIDMGEDVSQATNLSLSVQKPSGQTVTWIPQIQDTNYLRYVLQAGDVDLAGTYRIQPKLTLGTWMGYGIVVQLRVYELFE
jgi:hypothetical protein